MSMIPLERADQPQAAQASLLFSVFAGARPGRWRRARGGLSSSSHALLEGFDAGGDFAHHAGNLAAAEQQHDHDGDDDNAPNSWRVHDVSPDRLRTATRERAEIGSILGEHKDVFRIERKEYVASRPRTARPSAAGC